MIELVYNNKRLATLKGRKDTFMPNDRIYLDSGKYVVNHRIFDCTSNTECSTVTIILDKIAC